MGFAILAGAVMACACVAMPAAANVFNVAVSVDEDLQTRLGGGADGLIGIDPITVSAGDTVNLTLTFAQPLSFRYGSFILGSAISGDEFPRLTTAGTRTWSLIDPVFAGQTSGTSPLGGFGGRLAEPLIFLSSRHPLLAFPRFQSTASIKPSTSPSYMGSGDPPVTSWTFDDVYFYVKAGQVPEPATWAMMLLDFGAIGASARKRLRLGKDGAVVPRPVRE